MDDQLKQSARFAISVPGKSRFLSKPLATAAQSALAYSPGVIAPWLKSKKTR